MDVAEKDNAFIVGATIPGVRLEDIQVNVQGDG
jgi:HSP20 family molecular chaperone IbpA